MKNTIKIAITIKIVLVDPIAESDLSPLDGWSNNMWQSLKLNKFKNFFLLIGQVINAEQTA